MGSGWAGEGGGGHGGAAHHLCAEGRTHGVAEVPSTDDGLRGWCQAKELGVGAGRRWSERTVMRRRTWAQCVINGRAGTWEGAGSGWEVK